MTQSPLWGFLLLYRRADTRCKKRLKSSPNRAAAQKDRHIDVRTSPPLLLLLLVGAGLGSILAVRRMRSVVSTNGPSVDLRQQAGRSTRWSLAGLVGGLVGALIISRWDPLGRGVLLAAPLFGLVVLVSVCLGETTARISWTSHRQASLLTRRVREYLPTRLTTAVIIATTTLTISLIGATFAGSTDDLGRAGRSLTVTCLNGVTNGSGPWPGWFYAGPLLALTGLGAAAAAVALFAIVRRSRPGYHHSGQVDDADPTTTADDDLRRRSARTVVAASGVAVAIPLGGVTTFGAIALIGIECLPLAGRVVQYGWIAVIPLSTILLGWSAMTLVGDGIAAVAERWRTPIR